MSKFNKIQATFSSGEVSEKVKGRRELKEYHEADETLENFIVQPQGGIVKRPGSQFVTDDFISIAEDDIKLIPFIFSKSESYICVLDLRLQTP